MGAAGEVSLVLGLGLELELESHDGSSWLGALGHNLMGFDSGANMEAALGRLLDLRSPS